MGKARVCPLTCVYLLISNKMLNFAEILCVSMRMVNSKIWRLTTAIILVVLSFVSVGCLSSQQAEEMLAEVEACVQDEPERALELLRSVDRGALRGDYRRAHYALVASEVYYYNYIDSDCDTLTGDMAAYYLESEHNEERARALYQHALVLSNAGRNAEAIMMLNEAQLSDLAPRNMRLEALLHRLKGDIYGYGCLFSNALSEYLLARESFAKAELGYHAASTDYDIGTTYMLMRSYSEAERWLVASLDYCLESGNRDFASMVLRELLTLAVYADKFDSGEVWLSYFERYNIPIIDRVHYYATRAIMSAYRGRHAEAGELVAQAVELGGEDNNNVEYAHYLLARYRGDMQTALYWQERGKRRQDALVLESLEQPILNVEIDLLHNTLEAERKARSFMKQRNTIIWVSVLLLLLVAIAYIRARIRQKNEDIAQYIATIRELQLADRSVPEQMTSSVNTLYRDRFSELNHLCDIYYDHDGTSRQKNLVFDRLKETIEEIKHDGRRLHQLEEAVNLYRNNIYARMREQVPKLNDRDLRVALYVLAGFSNRAIAIFVDSDPSSVSKMRYNIKQKVKVANAADSEEFFAALSEK